MFLTLFTSLRAAKVPVTLREFLTLLDGVQSHVAEYRVTDFYHLARTCLVKDERHLDRFDLVFGQVFKGMEMLSDSLSDRRAHV